MLKLKNEGGDLNFFSVSICGMVKERMFVSVDGVPFRTVSLTVIPCGGGGLDETKHILNNLPGNHKRTSIDSFSFRCLFDILFQFLGTRNGTHFESDGTCLRTISTMHLYASFFFFCRRFAHLR